MRIFRRVCKAMMRAMRGGPPQGAALTTLRADECEQKLHATIRRKRAMREEAVIHRLHRPDAQQVTRDAEGRQRP